MQRTRDSAYDRFAEVVYRIDRFAANGDDHVSSADAGAGGEAAGVDVGDDDTTFATIHAKLPS